MMQIFYPERPLPNDYWRVLMLTDSLIGWQLGCQLASGNRGELCFLEVNRPSQSKDYDAYYRQVHQQVACEGVKIRPIVVNARPAVEDLAPLVNYTGADLIIIDDLVWYSTDHLDIPVIRLEATADTVTDNQKERQPINHLLVLSSGGARTAHLLRLFSALRPDAENPQMHGVAITVLFVLTDEKERAKQTAFFQRQLYSLDVDQYAQLRVQTLAEFHNDLAATESPYDLIIMGDSTQSIKGIGEQPVIRSLREQLPELMTVPVGTLYRPQLWSQIGERLVHLFDYHLGYRLRPLAYEKRQSIRARIRLNGRPRLDFWVLITLAAIIAGFGLMQNSVAVVIGAMLIAPLMQPIVSMGLAASLGRLRWFLVALGTTLFGCLLAVIVGYIVGALLAGDNLTSEILARTAPGLADFVVALFSGLAGVYAICDDEAEDAIGGVAIAAALVPPLVSGGIAISAGQVDLGLRAIFLFVTNLAAIVLVAAILFGVYRFRPKETAKLDRVRARNSYIIVIGLALLVSSSLFLFSFRLADEAARRAVIEEVVRAQVKAVLQDPAAEVVNFDRNSSIIPGQFRSAPVISDTTVIQESMLFNVVTLTVRVESSTTPRVNTDNLLQAAVSEQLPTAIAATRPIRFFTGRWAFLHDEIESFPVDAVRLQLIHIKINTPAEFSPLPTLTPTPEPDATATPIVTPTATSTPTLTPTPVPTATPSPTPTLVPTATPSPTVVPTNTPIPTATPVLLTVNSPYGVNMREDGSLSADIIAFVSADDTLIDLGQTITDATGRAWQQVQFGTQVGWVAREFVTPR